MSRLLDARLLPRLRPSRACPRGHATYVVKRFRPKTKKLILTAYCPSCCRFFSAARFARLDRSRAQRDRRRSYRLECRVKFDPYRPRHCPIYVTLLMAGRTVQLRVDLALDTGFDLVTLVAHALGDADPDYRLLYAGHQMDPTRCLAEYGLRKEATVHVVGRLRGD